MSKDPFTGVMGHQTEILLIMQRMHADAFSAALMPTFLPQGSIKCYLILNLSLEYQILTVNLWD